MMFRYNNGQFKLAPPATLVVDGFTRKFAELTREQWDALGYNEAVQIQRKPYTIYQTRWEKGADLMYREEVVSQTTDTVAQSQAAADAIRAERDRLLAGSDWTQLADSSLEGSSMVIWQSYRQALRDVPQQVSFPEAVEWPEKPAYE